MPLAAFVGERDLMCTGEKSTTLAFGGSVGMIVKAGRI